MKKALEASFAIALAAAGAALGPRLAGESWAVPGGPLAARARDGGRRLT